MNRVILGIGSNIEPQKHIAQVRRRIVEEHTLIAESRFVETEPIGKKDQPPFLNGAMLIETEMNREQLAQWLKSLENQLGRGHNGEPYAPRTIDIDIIVWNGQVVHNDFYEREFLQESVREILPDLHF